MRSYARFFFSKAIAVQARHARNRTPTTASAVYSAVSHHGVICTIFVSEEIPFIAHDQTVWYMMRFAAVRIAHAILL